MVTREMSRRVPFGTALAAIALFALACGDMYETADPDLDHLGDGGHDAASDTDSDTDSDSDSDTDSDSDSDADTDTASETDTGISEIDASSDLYQVGIDGFVMVVAHRHESVWSNYYASAQFYDITVAEEFFEEVVELDPLAGIDDCGLHIDEGWGWGSEGEMEWLTAGEVSVTSGPQYAVLAEMEGGDVIPYEVDLGALDYEPRYGETYSFATTGADSAAVDLGPAFTLPEDLQITSPDLDAEPTLPADDVTVVWTNPGDEGTVWIDILAEETFNGGAPYFVLECKVTDDGEFVLPGDLLAQIPGGWVAHLSIGRTAATAHDLDDGRTILGRGIVYESWNLSME